jgi:acetyl-CoA carboxylase biotin carboxyl carrier protein
MREDEIKRLVKIVEESNIGELEYSRWGRKIKITKTPVNSHVLTNSGPPHGYAPPQPAAPPQPGQIQAQPSAQKAESPVEEKPKKSSASSIEIKSPMVGTFYRAPAPDAEAYVEVSSTVKTGEVLCIIEAMKLMNEIESEANGRILEILVDDGQPVEYNQPLFLIEPV